MKSLTVADSFSETFAWRFRHSAILTPHQLSDQKLIFSPFPSNQEEFSNMMGYSLLMLLQIDDET